MVIRPALSTQHACFCDRFPELQELLLLPVEMLFCDKARFVASSDVIFGVSWWHDVNEPWPFGFKAKHKDCEVFAH